MKFLHGLQGSQQGRYSRLYSLNVLFPPITSTWSSFQPCFAEKRPSLQRRLQAAVSPRAPLLHHGQLSHSRLHAVSAPQLIEMLAVASRAANMDPGFFCRTSGLSNSTTWEAEREGEGSGV